jgi:hypothetical protein
VVVCVVAFVGCCCCGVRLLVGACRFHCCCWYRRALALVSPVSHGLASLAVQAFWRPFLLVVEPFLGRALLAGALAWLLWLLVLVRWWLWCLSKCWG